MRPRELAVAVVLAAGLLLAVPSLAVAHAPFLEPPAASDAKPKPDAPFPAAVKLPASDASLAVYGVLIDSETFDVYRVVPDSDRKVEVQLLVPARGDVASFTPALVVAGPADMAEPTASKRESIDAGTFMSGIQAGLGDLARVKSLALFVLFPERERRTFFEPFSLESLRYSVVTEVSLRKGETYYFLVLRPDGWKGRGDYVLGFSGPERFSGSDVGRTLVDLPRIWVGAYGQSGARPGPVLACLAVVLLLVVLVVLAVRFVRRRRAGRREKAARAG